MKIIFLDMDGVMNSQASAKRFKTFHKCQPESVDALNMIIDATGAKIVISSTWREAYGLDFVRGFLESAGVQRYSVIDATPVIRTKEFASERGVEINDWLSRQTEKPYSFVILDDDAWDMSPNQARFVKTDMQIGLNQTDALKAIGILKTPWTAPTIITTT